jgi:hypothetical protein
MKCITFIFQQGYENTTDDSGKQTKSERKQKKFFSFLLMLNCGHVK